MGASAISMGVCIPDTREDNLAPATQLSGVGTQGHCTFSWCCRCIRHVSAQGGLPTAGESRAHRGSRVPSLSMAGGPELLFSEVAAQGLVSLPPASLPGAPLAEGAPPSDRSKEARLAPLLTYTC